jgi:two-component system response regulator VicR
MLDAMVLVVDDNPETLDLMAFALESEGFRVRKAKTVLKALEMLHDGTTRPNLILTDLVMPQTSGRDFLKHLRDDETLKTLPIIVMTGADAGESAALADVVLQKPVDPLHVASTARTLLVSNPQP